MMLMAIFSSIVVALLQRKLRGWDAFVCWTILLLVLAIDFEYSKNIWPSLNLLAPIELLFEGATRMLYKIL